MVPLSAERQSKLVVLDVGCGTGLCGAEIADCVEHLGGVDVSPAMLEGFVSAKVLVEALRRAGPKPTRAKLQVALESIKGFDLGGLSLSFSTTDHTGLCDRSENPRWHRQILLRPGDRQLHEP